MRLLNKISGVEAGIKSARAVIGDSESRVESRSQPPADKMITINILAIISRNYNKPSGVVFIKDISFIITVQILDLEA